MRVEAKLCLGSFALPVYRSLLAEQKQPQPEKGRAKVSLTGDGQCIIVEVESASISGLRALFNSFMLLAYASYSSLRSVEAVGARNLFNSRG